MCPRGRSILSNVLTVLLIPSSAFAQGDASTSVRDGGISAIWMLANLAYAGMRAQGSASAGWRIIAFIFGLPGTLLTYFVVADGSERAYGVDLPKRR
jgi:hypothetical protein